MVIAVIAILAFVIACDVLELVVARRASTRRRPQLMIRAGDRPSLLESSLQ